MNKACKELLEKSIELDWEDEVPLFKGVYIIQQRRLHDSGFRMMYVIGHTEYDKVLKDFKYYLLSSCSDVVDFTPAFKNLLNKKYNMCDLHLDINKNGLIHIWTNSDKYLDCQCLHVSSCSFEIFGDKENENNNI